MAAHITINNQGNNAFKSGDYESALSSFTIGLSLVTDTKSRGLLLGNRSSTYLKLGRFQEAVSDARECVKIQPDWTKAYLKLGKALEASGNFSEVCELYATALKHGVEHRKVLLQPLVDANNKCMRYPSDFMDAIILGDKFCNICRQTEGKLLMCSCCHSVHYCSKEHQKQDWKQHKKQCNLLAEVHNSNLALASISNDTLELHPLMPFDTICSITNWDGVWKHMGINTKTSVYQQLASESLSWPLTLICSICKFNMDNRKHLCIHVLGAKDFCESYFRYNLPFFPVPDLEIILIGPELTINSRTSHYRSPTGRSLSISYVTDTWHHFMEHGDFVLPDLIIAYHPGIHDFSYNWSPTLRKIVLSGIPSVFTACSKEGFTKTVEMLNNDMLNTKILFNGHAPFPSLTKSSQRTQWNVYILQIKNSYWVGFKGGNPLTDKQV